MNANPLGLGPQLASVDHPTEASLRKQQVRCLRAKRLLDNDDFKWWTDDIIEPWCNMQSIKVVWNDMEYDRDLHIKRGIIRGVQKVLKDLSTMASSVDAVTNRLETLYGRRTDDRGI